MADETHPHRTERHAQSAEEAKHAEAKHAEAKHEEAKHEEAKHSHRTRPPEALVVDLGRKSKRDVDRLRDGRGCLMGEVEECLRDLEEAGGLSESVQPLVVVVKEGWTRPKAPPLPFLLAPGLPWCISSKCDDDDDDDNDDD